MQKKVQQGINPNDFEGLLEPKGTSKYSIKKRLDRERHERSKKPKTISLYIYRKGVPYPFCYIGAHVETLMKNLGCSKEDAEALYIAKLKEVLATIEDGEIKEELERRLRKLDVMLKKRHERERA